MAPPQQMALRRLAAPAFKSAFVQPYSSRPVPTAPSMKRRVCRGVACSAVQGAGFANSSGKTMEASRHCMSYLFKTKTFALLSAQRPYVWDESLALKMLDEFLDQVGEGTDEIE